MDPVGGVWGGEGGWFPRRPEEISRDDGNTLCLECGPDFIGEYIHQRSSSCTALIVSKVFFMKQ